jgi:hypothetical protein
MTYLFECILFLFVVIMHEPSVFSVAVHEHKFKNSVIFIGLLAVHACSSIASRYVLVTIFKLYAKMLK